MIEVAEDKPECRLVRFTSQEELAQALILLFQGQFHMTYLAPGCRPGDPLPQSGYVGYLKMDRPHD